MDSDWQEVHTPPLRLNIQGEQWGIHIVLFEQLGTLQWLPFHYND